MSLNASNFLLQELEARFEMQAMSSAVSASSYDYNGGSWANQGSGTGYTGPITTSGDGSYATLDDGSYTDGSDGSFPAYGGGYDGGGGGGGVDQQYLYGSTSSGAADSTTGPMIRVSGSCYCTICRCRF
jgi:hypothetical protein